MFVVTYLTESGDNGVLGVWKDRPTRAQIEAVGREHHPGEYEGTCPLIYTATTEITLLR